MNRFLSKNYLRCIIASLFLFVIVSEKSFALARSASSSGNWNSINWTPGGVGSVVAGDVLTVPFGFTVTVDVSTPALGGLTVSGTVTVSNLTC
jgi:hypothetical protein